ncbi:type IV toxin-antitoxin system YeeU family antitoxin [Rahnella aceris]|uniref:type IV toxin-antitoxin system YeeU family antitoxin n=1 Tax=Rahnella sp. (strain Y9602) TaxID=2703885 RepID=UPI0014200CD4|nr:type IV toxin-antitoxin system YeeU family antitoxin [Rahnella aceris]NIA89385.1 type IV toxin-antitoxin system YeeU family antitoxin [Rahnella aceris]
MKSVASASTSPEDNPSLQWGLNREVTPSFGARLVQEGNRLHFLADRAGFNGAFSEDEALRIDQAFPLMLKQLELKLLSGELKPRCQHCVTLHHNGLICEADSLGSHGYIYLTIYPASQE